MSKQIRSYRMSFPVSMCFDVFAFNEKEAREKGMAFVRRYFEWGHKITGADEVDDANVRVYAHTDTEGADSEITVLCASGLTTAPVNAGDDSGKDRLKDRTMIERTVERTKRLYATTYHRDGTVTVWDVYRQQWVRTSRPSDQVLAACSSDRARIKRHCGIED